uniref:Uncharacterized protein n=1 Tax=Arundo donax TaxID=35708 RepID=A0A0A9UD64_ARUDO
MICGRVPYPYSPPLICSCDLFLVLSHTQATTTLNTSLSLSSFCSLD